MLATGEPLPPVLLVVAVDPPEVVLVVAAPVVAVDELLDPPQAAIKGETIPAAEMTPRLRKSVRRDTCR